MAKVIQLESERSCPFVAPKGACQCGIRPPFSSFGAVGRMFWECFGLRARKAGLLWRVVRESRCTWLPLCNSEDTVDIAVCVNGTPWSCVIHTEPDDSAFGCSILAWRIPRGAWQTRVGHD